jgi:hypothetical protein
MKPKEIVLVTIGPYGSFFSQQWRFLGSNIAEEVYCS